MSIHLHGAWLVVVTIVVYLAFMLLQASPGAEEFVGLDHPWLWWISILLAPVSVAIEAVIIVLVAMGWAAIIVIDAARGDFRRKQPLSSAPPVQSRR